MDTTSLPVLEGKVIIVYADGLTEGIAIEQGKYEMIGDRLFITGLQARSTSPQGWADGTPCGACWDRATGFMLFSSLTEYSDCYRNYEPTRSWWQRLFGQ